MKKIIIKISALLFLVLGLYIFLSAFNDYYLDQSFDRNKIKSTGIAISNYQIEYEKYTNEKVRFNTKRKDLEISKEYYIYYYPDSLFNSRSIENNNAILADSYEQNSPIILIIVGIAICFVSFLALFVKIP